MIHIKYKLKESSLHGIGLFAGENIKKGMCIYSASPFLDVNISEEIFASLSTKEQDEIKWWGFFIEEEKVWHVDFDVSRFINHSFDGNISQKEEYKDAYLIATRDIFIDEELTQNYLEFETKEDLAKRGIIF